MRSRSLCLLASGLVAASSWSACKSAEPPPPADDPRVQTLEEQLQAAKQEAAALRATLDETNARLSRLAEERDDQAALLQQQEKERAERSQQQDDRAREQTRRLDALEHALARRPQEPGRPQEPSKAEPSKAEPVLASVRRSPDDEEPIDQLRELREQLQRLREQLQQELRAQGVPLRNCTPSRQSVDRHGSPSRTEMTKREAPPETGKGKKVID